MTGNFLRHTLLVAGKDLRIEGRSREVLYTMAFSAALVVLVFSFALSNAADPAQGPIVAAGVLWAATLLTGTVALGRVLDRERENEAIRALLLSPVPRSAIYAGKLIAVFLLMLAVEVAVVVLVSVLFSTEVFAHPGYLALVLMLGTLGFAATGVVFSAALLRSRSRDALLGALLFPIVIPALLAASRATACMFDPLAPDLQPVLFWLRFLFATDVVYIALGLWLFEPVVCGD
ncbi:MAG: heme exporter protein CcmB [Deltaproteobacteria bacterium]|nr:heme exporter protein CcmB [Deltaproteobacteria bacterium]